MRPSLHIRADGNTAIGCGHIFRCLAYAQEWKRRGGRVTYLIHDDASVRNRLHAEGMAVENLNAVPASKRDAELTGMKAGEGWVVLDGYHFSSEYQNLVKRAGARLLVIDDDVEELRFRADVVLNYHGYADESMYPNREPNTRLLLGAFYAPLRSEFLIHSKMRRAVPKLGRRILVTCGGGDATNLTEELLRILEHVQISDLEVRVICGPANRAYESLRALARESRHSVVLSRPVRNMAKHMEWADIGLTAGGLTALELAFMRVPRVIFITAANQERTVTDLAQKGEAVNAGWTDKMDAALVAGEVERLVRDQQARRELAAAGRSSIDGRGPERVVSAMRGEKARPRPARVAAAASRRAL